MEPELINELSNNNNQRPSSSQKTSQESKLHDLKYSFCTDEELPKIAEELMLRSQNPEKIGIFSSGGMSNNIIEKIKNEHYDLLKNQSFEVFLETFSRSMVPTSDPVISAEEAGAPPQDNTSLSPGATMDQDIESTPILVQESEPSIHFDSINSDPNDSQPSSELEEQFESFSIDGEEYNFIPEEEPPWDESSPEESGQEETQHEEPETEELQLEPKPLSFRERAYHVFVELKRKLGFIKPSQNKPEIEPEDDLPIEQLPEEEIDGQEPWDMETDPFFTSTSTSTSTPLEPDEHELMDSEESAIEFTPITASTPGPEPESEPSVEPVQKTAKRDLVNTMVDKDILFIVTCLDDEHDIENAMTMSELSRKMNQLTIVIASLPRYFGNVDNIYAMNRVLQKLRLKAEIVILVPYYESIEFKLIPKLISEVLELVTVPGLINIDVADLRVVVNQY